MNAGWLSLKLMPLNFLFIDSITKLETLSQTLPTTTEEVEEVVERYQILLTDTEANLQTITTSYDTHNSLHQSLTHVESRLADLEEQVKSASHEKNDTEQLNQTLQVRQTYISTHCRFLSVFLFLSCVMVTCCTLYRIQWKMYGWIG